MFLRLTLFLSIVVIGISCDRISPGRTSPQNRVMVDTVIDYHAVDVYPLFLDCNNCDSYDKQNLCFEMELLRRLQSALAEQRIGGTLDVPRDTVFVDVLVNTDGKISISDIHSEPGMKERIPDLDSLLYRSFEALPTTIQPSLKRGIPVNTVFKLPLVLSSAP